MYLLKQRVHPTWMFTATCAGLLVGIALAQAIPWVPAPFAIIGCALVGIGLWQHRAWMFTLAIAGGLLIGAWRGGLEVQGVAVYKGMIGKEVTLTGQVSADPQAASRGGQSISVTHVGIHGWSLEGTVYATVGETPVLRRDDKVTLQGVLSEAKGNYAAAVYDATIVKVDRPQNFALDMRDGFNAAVRGVLPEPEASLGIGILVGQKTALPSDFTEALKIAGLTHIVVASGYNLTILVRLARRLFSRISRYQAAAWSVSLILVFMAITGWSASMTRAGLVAGLSLWAWYYGRKFHPVTLLLFAAAVTAFVHPPYAWGDVGWALSFTAFAGVIVLAPLLTAYFYEQRKPSFVAQILIETVSAQIATLPIMLGVFGQFSVVALMSNVMTLPLIPLAMLLTFLASSAQIVLPLVAGLFGGLAQALLGYLVWVVNWTASLPWALVQWQMPAWGVLCSYLALIGLCVWLRHVTRYNLRQVNIVE